MEEYKVGEVFQFGSRKLKCVEGECCFSCALEGLDSCNYFVGNCFENERSDHKSVVFVIVKEECNH